MTMTTPNKTIIPNTFRTVSTALSRVVPVLIFLLLSAQTLAGTVDRTITLDEALKLGLANSNVVKLSKAKIDQAISKYEQAKDGALPDWQSQFLLMTVLEIPANKTGFGKESIFAAFQRQCLAWHRFDQRSDLWRQPP